MSYGFDADEDFFAELVVAERRADAIDREIDVAPIGDVGSSCDLRRDRR